TFEAKYFRAALELQDAFEQRFADARGGYAMTSSGHEGLILRPREVFDGATPSSNSVAAMNLLRLASVTRDSPHPATAENVLSTFSAYLERIPTALPKMLNAVDYLFDFPREIVLSGEPGDSGLEALREVIFSSDRLNRVVALADQSGSLDGLSPLVEERKPAPGGARAFVCENFTCRRPISDPAELRAALDG